MGREVISSIGAAGLILVGACDPGRDETEATAEAPKAADPARTDAARVANSKDGNWITLSGEIVSTATDSFLLDYGRGNVTVEMDDWDWYKEGQLLKSGHRVVVLGRVDKQLLVNKTIEASSVFVQNLNTYFYASGSDEERVGAKPPLAPSSLFTADYTGVISALEGREFTMATAGGPIRVDTSSLRENPLDQEGFQRLKSGDRVYVWGDLDLEKAEGTELNAKGVISLSRDKSKTAQ